MMTNGIEQSYPQEQKGIDGPVYPVLHANYEIGAAFAAVGSEPRNTES